MRGRPELLCATCWRAAPDLEAQAARRAHPLCGRLDALQENRASVIAGASIVVVLALLAATGAAQVLSPAYREQMGEAVGAVRRGAPAVGVVGGGASSAATSAGAPASMTRVQTLVQPFFGSASSIAEQVPGMNPAALVDGMVGESAAVWRTPPGFTIAEVRVRVRDATPAARVLFAHSTVAARETWARDVEVWVSLRPDWSEEIRVGVWALAATTEPQTFPMALARVASARVRILSNHGGADHTTLAEFALLAG